MTAKEEFTPHELEYYTKWWQEKLFLTDWVVVSRLCAPDDFKEQGNCGENEFDLVNKSCVIRILDKKYYGDRIMRYCAEKILVHELLHCKYNFVANDNSYEGVYFDTMEHALLEQMAKSLIMAKYDLPFEYWNG